MKASIEVLNREEADQIRDGLADPKVRAFVKGLRHSEPVAVGPVPRSGDGVHHRSLRRTTRGDRPGHRDPVMEFFLSCVPPKATHHAKKIVRVGKFARLADNDKLVVAKETIDTLLLEHRPPHPMSGPTVLALEFTWPWRLKDKAGARARGRIPCDVRPDCSNLAKTTEDRLVALRFLEDDGQVVALLVRKWFGDTAGIHVRLWPFDSRVHNTDQPADLFAALEG